MSEEQFEKLPELLLTGDFETGGLHDAFRLGALYDGNAGEQVDFYEDLEDLMYLLNDYGKAHKVICYFHNLDFDIRYVYTAFGEFIDRKNGIDIAGNAKRVRFTKNDKFKYIHNVQLRDSFSLITSSLDRACKDFGLPEQYWKRDIRRQFARYIPCEPQAACIDHAGYRCEEPVIINGKLKSFNCYNLEACKGRYFKAVAINDADFREYLKYDVISLYKLLEVFKKELRTIASVDVKLGLTAASTALNTYMACEPDNYELIKLCMEQEFRAGYIGEKHKCLDLVRLAYKGGRSEVFKHEGFGIFYYDVNSLYPSQMESQRFPVFPIYHEKITLEEFEEWRKQGMYIVKAKVFVPDMHIPPLPYHAGPPFDKLVFPVGTFTDAFCSPELNYAIDNYGVKVLEVSEAVFYLEDRDLFSKFIAKIKPFKTEHKGAVREVAKLLQNSLYGKFGQREITNVARRYNLKNVTDVTRFDAGGWHTVEYVNDSLVWAYYNELTRKLDHNYVSLAAFVTSYARLHWYHMAEALDFDVINGDTDSAVSEKQLPESMVHDTKYGLCKLEYTAKHIVAMRPKWYGMLLYEPDKTGNDEVIRNKGVFKAFLMREVGFDGIAKFYDGYKKGTVKVEIIPISANIHTTRKARDMFRRKTGSEQVYRIADSRHVYKTQTLEDNKRVQLSDKVHTKPLKFKDDVLVE